MKKDIESFFKKTFPVLPGMKKKCAHTGEKDDFCGQCGADLRSVTKYECNFCSFKGRITTYGPDDVPSFCRKCGAPRFTFTKTLKKK